MTTPPKPKEAFAFDQISEELRQAIERAQALKAKEKEVRDEASRLSAEIAQADDKVNEFCTKIIKHAIGDDYEPRIILYPGVKKKY